MYMSLHCIEDIFFNLKLSFSKQFSTVRVLFIKKSLTLLESIYKIVVMFFSIMYACLEILDTCVLCVLEP